MHFKIAPVKNITRLGEAGQALINRPMGLPGMALVWGETGFGKTTAIAWLRNQTGGIYMRALAVWTANAMIRGLVTELGGLPKGSSAVMMERAIELLADNPRPIMIDEADYVIGKRDMVETLRDLHDQTSAPVILIGMEGIERTIKARKQLTGRIQQWVKFEAADLEDAAILAETLAEIEIEDGLLAELHRSTGGSVRLIVVGLSRIEQFGRARGLAAVTGADWDGRDFFFGDAPRQAA